MRRTLLEGTPTVTAKAICDKLRNAKADGRKALPRQAWEKVMDAGLRECLIAKLLNPGTPGVKLIIQKIPSDNNDGIAYHNDLMRLCCTSMREFTEALKRGAQKAKTPGNGEAGAPGGAEVAAATESAGTNAVPPAAPAASSPAAPEP
eukprot:7954161-Karenia_brevis.AAC.1